MDELRYGGSTHHAPGCDLQSRTLLSLRSVAASALPGRSRIYPRSCFFQLAADHGAPRCWPDSAYPQQSHLDFEVEGFEAASAQVT